MRNLLIFFLLLPLSAFAQQFQFHQELDSIPVWDGDYQMPAPWTGGYAMSHPALCDLDGDGDYDLFLGQGGGTIAYYRNDGTTSEFSFHLSEANWQGINVVTFSSPSFRDIDADGDYDLFSESGDLRTYIYLNNGTPIMPNFVLAEDTLKDLNGVPIDGTYGDFVDIDQDGDLDFFTGTWYSGTVRFYRNIGTPADYSLLLIDSNVLGVTLGNRIKLKFCDIDADGDYDLFVGDYYGHIHFYRNDGTPRQYDFTLVSDNWMNISVGNNASPEFADLDDDGDFDMVVGKDNAAETPTPPGAVHYYLNIGTSQVPDMQLVTQSFLTFDAGMSSIAGLRDIDHDGDLDLFFMTNYLLGWMKNVGTPQNPLFEVKSYNLLSQAPSTFAFTNLDSDSLPDLVTAEGWSGVVHYWRTILNNGQLSFQPMGQMDTPYCIGVTMGDLDGDGQDEMLLGGFHNIPGDQVLVYYENQSTPGNPNFVFVTENYQNLIDNLQWIVPDVIPWLSDIDMDGDQDLLFVNLTTNTILLYENQGTPQQALFVLTSQDFLGLGPINPPMFDCGDIDADGDMDVFAGSYPGGITFFRNVTGDSVGVKPSYKPPIPSKTTLSLFPNPSNAGTVVRFTLPGAGLVRVGLFDVEGRLLSGSGTTPTTGFFPAGTHDLRLDASDLPSGVYLIRIATSGSGTTPTTVTGKVVILK